MIKGKTETERHILLRNTCKVVCQKVKYPGWYWLTFCWMTASLHVEAVNCYETSISTYQTTRYMQHESSLSSVAHIPTFH